VSKSFGIDLDHYKLTRTIGDGGKTLRTAVDRSDLINCLEGLGYTRLAEVSFGNGRFGMIPDFEDALYKQTLGVPTSANVEVNRVGQTGNFYHISFIY
jgi:hypothetical protein